MTEAPEYASPAPPQARRPKWVGALLLVAVVCGFAAHGKAASARGGPLPGELGTVIVLVAAAVGLCAAAVHRHVRSPARRDPVNVSMLVTGTAVAVAVAAAAVWELAHCRW